MLASAIIVFRETLEAALLIGIVAAASRSISGRTRWIVGGVIAGAIGAGIVALSTEWIALLFEGMGQELFNAVVLAIALVLLAWHQIWMSTHSRQLTTGAQQIAKDVQEGRRELTAVFVVVALAVLREGAETVLFLYGLLSGGDTSRGELLSGGLAGLLAGATLGTLLYAGMLRIPLRWFFSVISILIILLAAGMASKMTQLLIQADFLPSLVNPLWDTSSVLPRDSVVGVLMHALAGYEPRPAGMQVVAFALTVAVILIGTWLARRSAMPAR